MARPRLIAARLWLALLVALAQAVALAPSADAQELQPQRAIATWTPKSISARELAGICPVGDFPDAPCPIVRGTTYQTSVTFSVDQPVQPLIIQPVGNGLEIVATSRATGGDFTRALAANQTETIDLSVTVPEATGRKDRSFYLGKLMLVGGDANVSGVLSISVAIPKPRLTWGRLQLNDGSGDAAPMQTIVGAGSTFTRKVTVTSSLEIDDFAIRSNSDRITVAGAPATLPAGRPQDLLVTFNAPIVNRKTRMEVSLTPVGGITPLSGTLRMRVTVLPATVKWGPPQIRATLNAAEQKPLEKTLTITSNYDIPNVQFKTEDVGLTPILSPLGPVNLRAGVPQQVRVRLCPGYAPTTYFLGLTAYQGSKPLNQRLQIKMTVEGDSASIKPLPEGAADPCAAP
ncbi:MAG TPA: hypothetical protein VGL23_19875 [Chloroflexota bacterium]